MPDDRLQRLRDGNARFVAGRAAHAGADARTLRSTLKGQRPFACVLACSDSRVPVEFVFDQGVGDLFVVRTAGNTAGGHEVASLAFAVGVLRTPVLVVMGHTDCGAIRDAVASGACRAVGAVFNTATGRVDFVDDALDHAAPAAATGHAHA
jgi:carbonic anhydrase